MSLDFFIFSLLTLIFFVCSVFQSSENENFLLGTSSVTNI